MLKTVHSFRKLQTETISLLGKQPVWATLPGAERTGKHQLNASFVESEPETLSFILVNYTVLLKEKKVTLKKTNFWLAFDISSFKVLVFKKPQILAVHVYSIFIILVCVCVCLSASMFADA